MSEGRKEFLSEKEREFLRSLNVTWYLNNRKIALAEVFVIEVMRYGDEATAKYLAVRDRADHHRFSILIPIPDYNALPQQTPS